MFKVCNEHARIAVVVSLGMLLTFLPANSVDAQPGKPDPLGNTVFTDTFDTYSNRWAEHETAKSQVAYRDGVLDIRVNSPGVYAWSVPDFSMNEAVYTVRAHVQFRGGSPDSQAGCVLAYAGDDAFLAFLVTAHGEWQFVRRHGEAWITLATQDTASSVGVRDQLLYDLRIDVYGRILKFWINDEYVGTVVVDEAVLGNRFGVIARAGHGYVEAAFDTIQVIALDRESDRGTTD